MEILAEDDSKLNSFEVNADKGFNYFDFDMSTSEKSIKSYFNKKDIKIEQAKNNVYYLPKGNYFVKIKDVKKEFEVK